jgi:hypothetical protein
MDWMGWDGMDGRTDARNKRSKPRALKSSGADRPSYTVRWSLRRRGAKAAVELEGAQP